MKIKVKEIIEGCKFNFLPQGEWIDLRAAETVAFKAPQASSLRRETINGEQTSRRDVTFDFKAIKLGIAMELPKGLEAIMLPRSSTLKNFGVISANSQGVIDNSYSGDGDEWGFPAIALRETTINKGDRICQFRIQPSQKATIRQKIKWLLTRKIEFKWVDKLHNSNRGGFGSTGKK